ISDLFRWGRADAVVLLLGPFAGYGRVQPAHLALRATLPYSVLYCIHYPRIRLSVRCSQGGQPPHGTPQVRRAFSQLAGIAICCSSSIGHGQRHVVKRRGVFWSRNLFVHETADCELALSHHFRPACRCHRQIIDEKTTSYRSLTPKTAK